LQRHPETWTQSNYENHRQSDIYNNGQTNVQYLNENLHVQSERRDNGYIQITYIFIYYVTRRI